MRALLALLFVSALAPTAFAAIVPTTNIRVVLTATPSYPQPAEAVTMKASASVPLGTYTYRWEIDGELYREAVDLDRVSFQAGAAGTENTVSVTLIDPNGRERGRAQYVLAPASVDLLWEGRTYTPPLYAGRPYPNGESMIVIEAIPRLGVADDQRESYIYEWEADGKKLASLSGVGRYSVEIPAATYRYTTAVTVTVRSADRSVAAKQSVSIPHARPRIVVYEDRPLVGVWYTRALTGSVPFQGEEMTVRAVPFFFENPSALAFSWLLNGNPIALTENPDVVTLRRSGNGEAVFRISTRAEKSGSIFEIARTVFNVSLN